MRQLEFNQLCLDFVERCQDLSDDWYLLRVVSGKQEKLSIESARLDDLSNQQLILTRTEIRNVPQKKQLWSYEYSVTYSDSYEVPVMYFTVSHQSKFDSKNC